MGVAALTGGDGPSGSSLGSPAPHQLVRRRRLATFAGLAASLLVAVAFVVYAIVISRQVPTVKYANLVLYPAPDRAPSFNLERLGSGTAVTSAELAGNAVVVNWFQSTCVACQAEIGTFASVARQEQSKLRFVGIDVNEPSPANALAMVRRAKADYPVAQAPGAGGVMLATRFGVGDLPATVFVSTSGRVLGEVLGQIPRAELVALLSNLAAGRPLNS